MSNFVGGTLGQTVVSSGWGPVVLLIIMAVGFAVMNLILSSLIGPSRTGSGKERTYESGMVPTGDTSRRFNVRFYIVAMIFLVFDVEIVFFYPWASIYSQFVQANSTPEGWPFTVGSLMLIEMLLFVTVLLVSFIYAWGKGVFRFD